MKNQLNNKKGSKIKGKSTKIAAAFMQNKPNLSKNKFGAKHFSTRIYERFHPLPKHKNKPNQTQFKANSNPIPERPKMNLNIYYIKVYNNETYILAPKTKPKQTQFKPNKIALKIYPFGIDCPIVFEEKLFQFVG